MAHDVFISYANVDKEIADAVCACLERGHIRCWIAPRDVPAGQRYAEAILKALHEARAVVLVFSSAADASPQVQREIDRAVSGGQPILPLRVEDVLPTACMEYYLAGKHWLDALTPPLQAHLDRLRVVIGTLLEAPLVPRAAPEPFGFVRTPAREVATPPPRGFAAPPPTFAEPSSPDLATPPLDPAQSLDMRPRSEAPATTVIPAVPHAPVASAACEACGKRRGELFTVWTGELVGSVSSSGATTTSYAVSEWSMYICRRCRLRKLRPVLAIIIVWTCFVALVFALFLTLLALGESGATVGGEGMLAGLGGLCAAMWVVYAFARRSRQLGQQRVAAILKRSGYRVDEYWVQAPRITFANR